MKGLILACCLMCANIGYGQYTLVPDSNFEQALIDLGIDDDGLNGQFLTANALGIGTLNVDNNNISDLSGIEAFVDLENLDASENDLTSIDLSVLPNGMWTLNLGDNNLTSIDLSYITEIVNLGLYSNNFTLLDASNLNHIFILSASNNPLLTELTLTNTTTLQVLQISNTSVEDIDLSDSFSLRGLYAFDSQLQNLDFSNNPNIEEISCYNIPLTSINLPNQPELELLEIDRTQLTELDITNCPNLDRLSCTEIGLTALDLSGNPVLDYLNCSDNQLTTIDLSYNSLLTRALFENNNVGPELDLINTVSLEEINCSNNPIEQILNVSSSVNLEKILCEETSLIEIDLSENYNLFIVDFYTNPNLVFANMRNGFNNELSSFIGTNCPQLSCVVVDDPTAINTNFAINNNTTLVGSIEECEDLSISEAQLQQAISVFPNPVQDYFYIASEENISIQQIQIFDVLGRLVYTESKPTNKVDISKLARGILFLEIITSKGRLTKKVVKE